MSWLGSISEWTDETPTRWFSADELRSQSDLFAHRAALFFTPTHCIPDEWVGSGSLSATLRLMTPDWTELAQIRAYASPRLWVDQLQRATGKIRWRPHNPAEVCFSRHDIATIRDDHLASGMKALRDALKVSTHGRADGLRLHYFGAIVDDDDRHLLARYEQHSVPTLEEARVEVRADAWVP